MWLKKLKYRKLQFLLLGIILFVSALVFSTSLSFTFEANRLGVEYYSRDGAPNLLYFGSDPELAGTIQRTVPDATLKAAEGVSLTEPIRYRERKISGLFMVLPLEDYSEALFEIAPVEGDTDSSGPRRGEVWISKLWSDFKDIEVGDTIILQGDVSLRVGALVNTYVNADPGITLFFFIINPDDMSKLPELPSSFLVSLQTTGDLEQVKRAISSAFEDSNILSIDNDELASAFSFSSTILGGIGILSSILIFIVACFVIRFMLRSNLIKEYRSIGIYKSQGFSNRSIRGFYFKCYIFVGGISMLLGIVASLPAISSLNMLLTRYLPDPAAHSYSVAILVISFFVFFIPLILNVYFATRQIKKITPVSAVHIGISSSKAKFKKPIIKDAYAPFSMAINDIGKHKGYSIMIVLILCVSFFLSMFSLSMKTTIDEMTQNVDAWLSIPSSDFYVSGRIDEELIHEIESNPSVKKVIVSDEWLRTSVKLDETYGINRALLAMCFSDFSDVSYLQGRGPETEKEIAISRTLLRNAGLKTGDYVSLTLGDRKDTYLITGTFDAMLGSGESVHLLSESLPAHGVEFVPGVLMVMLNDGVQPDELIADINRNHDGTQAARNLDLVSDLARSYQQMTSPVMLVLMITFITFSILCIANLIIQNHTDNRRQYGIMKALGFSTGYIAARSTWRILLLSLIAAAFSMALHVVCSRGLFASAIGVDTLLLAIPQVVSLLLCLLGLIMLMTLLFCLPIRKITPQELIEE